MTDDVEIRQAEDHEFEAVVACCGAALGWKPGDPNVDFFRWKHRDNHFGPSPIWVAVDHDDIVGVRVMMRWQLARGAQTLQMVRAVDTATLPSHQGKGIFTKLTRAAVESLTAEGFDGVFNTPNDQSRPGYLKMGWTDVGRAPIAVRPRSATALPRLLRSRVAAGKWGEPSGIGTDSPDLAALADRWNPPSGWHTPISADYLAWRYGFSPLGYRFTDEAVVRLRTRGSVRELSICDVFAPSLPIGSLLREARADVAIGAGLGLRDGFVPAPPLGPRLTWRTLANANTPSLDNLALSLGSLELF